MKKVLDALQETIIKTFHSINKFLEDNSLNKVKKIILLFLCLVLMSGMVSVPGITDTAYAASTVSKPVFSIDSGTYNNTLTVTLSCGTEGATIYYTTDGSTPKETSNKYTGNITVSSTSTIKAIGIKAGMTKSTTATEKYTLKVATPALDTAKGTYCNSINVKITCATQGADIFYTIDGSTPKETSNRYNGNICVSSTSTIKAIAIKAGMTNSVVEDCKYTFKAAKPVFRPVEGTYPNDVQVSIETETSGASIYYTTNGSTPTSKSTKYTKPFAVSQTDSIKAVAIKDGMSNSLSETAKYTLEVADPVFSVESGTSANNQNIQIACATAGADIFYTTNGSTPTKNSAKYSNAILITANTKVKAIAIKEGYSNSNIVTKEYVAMASAPKFSLAEGTYTGKQTVRLTTDTAGADIYYTTNGSTPTKSSKKYTDPISVDIGTTTIKAVAIKSDMEKSGVSSALYTILEAAPAADLIITKVVAVPDDAAQGKYYLLTTFKNVGKADMPQGSQLLVHYYLDGKLADATSDAVTIKAGKSCDMYSLTSIAPVNGCLNIKAVVDPDNKIAESNEANNTYNTSINIAPVTASMSYIGNPLTTGKAKLHINVSGGNSSQRRTYKYYVSTQYAAFDNAQINSGNGSITLNEGENSKAVDALVTLGGSGSVTTSVVIVDGDNMPLWNGTITNEVQTSATLSDLRVFDGASDSDIIIKGTPVNFYANITNISKNYLFLNNGTNNDEEVVVNVRFEIHKQNREEKYDNSTLVEAVTGTYKPVEDNDVLYTDKPFRVDAASAWTPEIKSGKYVLVAVVDPEGKIEESNKMNNRMICFGFIIEADPGENNTGYLSFPTQSKQITSWFGKVDGTANAIHMGIDIQSNSSEKVVSAVNGMVVYAGKKSNSYGNIVIINSKYDGKYIQTRYSHLADDSICVNVGDEVYCGTPIGQTGNSGVTNGLKPIVNFEVLESTDGKQCALSASNCREIDPLLMTESFVGDTSYLDKPFAIGTTPGDSYTIEGSSNRLSLQSAANDADAGSLVGARELYTNAGGQKVLSDQDQMFVQNRRTNGDPLPEGCAYLRNIINNYAKFTNRQPSDLLAWDNANCWGLIPASSPSVIYYTKNTVPDSIFSDVPRIYAETECSRPYVKQSQCENYLSTKVPKTQFQNFEIGSGSTPEGQYWINLKKERNKLYNTVTADAYDWATLGKLTSACLCNEASTIYYDAQKALGNYLLKTGNQQTFDFKEMIERNRGAYENFWNDCVNAMRAGQALATEGKVTCFASIQEEGRSISTTDLVIDLDKNWEYTVNDYRTWSQGYVTKNGNQYAMTWNYHLRDYYDYEINGSKDIAILGIEFIKDSDCAKLHRCGLAKEYDNVGEVTVMLRWTEGEYRRQFVTLEGITKRY